MPTAVHRFRESHGLSTWTQRTVLSLLTWAIIFVLGVLSFLQVLRLSSNIRSQLSKHEWTYVDDDFPEYLPLDLGPARWTMQDTVHYGINGSDADEEWESSFPRGEGFIYLGPDKRRFGLSTFHQMHCLQMIRGALTSENIGRHTTHCLTYLRLMILCRADLQLEPASDTGDWTDVEWVRERECKDWGQLYEWIGGNYDEYVASQKA
ncbi:hypothetical protein GLOTRDRAFT_93611 [Gloeophyllum trabeum ATCC 11539]|uniref:Oxidase ustYa n=1 Tax=Gloeophyllum trabeum (strain ATCC 11539 / FP-39264 / Madison 617) TaxID=670483 RepID=S7RL09_GLOTA|nr:uncharacterized protein GLOTRDRAFT_93611 [Gloeophyllum trabeum ATCC 11539]EPQ55045.1 hypothetical protein GLOTRDRAFT_93611 [Gloeophyllum trabeum ATCC 11539]